ncbi:hypothetical protein EVAR_80351_1 [Eumeta japonica]|uniref:Uncharacterized protein n=1 Tax=Eumeta variegata TaxID=151549 RepID=A0A4C1WYN9_EUMVA|nr:hypothetical protein EVAR_80351_1 [Eumeta japonica]
MLRSAGHASCEILNYVARLIPPTAAAMWPRCLTANPPSERMGCLSSIIGDDPPASCKDFHLPVARCVRAPVRDICAFVMHAHLFCTHIDETGERDARTVGKRRNETPERSIGTFAIRFSDRSGTVSLFAVSKCVLSRVDSLGGDGSVVESVDLGPKTTGFNTQQAQIDR